MRKQKLGGFSNQSDINTDQHGNTHASLKQVITAGVIGAFLVAAGAKAALGRGSTMMRSARIESIRGESQPGRAHRHRVKQGTATLTGKVRTAEEKATAGKRLEVRGVAGEQSARGRPDVDRSTPTRRPTRLGRLDKAVDATNKAAHKTKEAVEKDRKSGGKGRQGHNATSDLLRKVGDKATDASSPPS